MKAFAEKLKESAIAVLPIAIIVLVLGIFAAEVKAPAMVNFGICTLLLVVGISLFSMGVDMSMMKIGRYIGSSTSKTKNIIIMAIIATVMGFVITIAEPDLTVLAGQVPGLSSKWVIILTVSIGTGIFLAIALIRIMFKIDLRIMLGVCYGVILILCFFVSPNFLPLSFDSSGVTTGPISVPFIMAFGAGISAIRSGKDAQNDSFGLIAMVSVGPIIAVMIMSFFVKTTGTAGTEAAEIVTKFSQIPTEIFSGLWHQVVDVLIIVAPIAAIFLAVNFIVLKLPKAELAKIMIGLLYTYVGIVVFFAGVNVGFMPLGSLLGKVIAGKDYNWILVPVSLLIGACIVFAEPAIHVLTKQIEALTEGVIGRKVMLICLSVGVALSVCVAVLRNFFEINILYFLIPIILINLALLCFCPKIFVAIAFDSGGAASGAMATAFVIPFIKGICDTFGNAQLLYGFGTVALIALMPIMCIQILGVVFKIATDRKHAERKVTAGRKAKVKIIDFDYGE